MASPSTPHRPRGRPLLRRQDPGRQPLPRLRSEGCQVNRSGTDYPGRGLSRRWVAPTQTLVKRWLPVRRSARRVDPLVAALMIFTTCRVVGAVADPVPNFQEFKTRQFFRGTFWLKPTIFFCCCLFACCFSQWCRRDTYKH